MVLETQLSPKRASKRHVSIISDAQNQQTNKKLGIGCEKTYTGSTRDFLLPWFFFLLLWRLFVFLVLWLFSSHFFLFFLVFCLFAFSRASLSPSLLVIKRPRFLLPYVDLVSCLLLFFVLSRVFCSFLFCLLPFLLCSFGSRGM